MIVTNYKDNHGSPTKVSSVSAKKIEINIKALNETKEKFINNIFCIHINPLFL